MFPLIEPSSDIMKRHWYAATPGILCYYRDKQTIELHLFAMPPNLFVFINILFGKRMPYGAKISPTVTNNGVSNFHLRGSQFFGGEEKRICFQ